MSKKIRDTTSRLRARAGWSNVLIGESNVAIVPAIGRYGVEDIYLGEFLAHCAPGRLPKTDSEQAPSRIVIRGY